MNSFAHWSAMIQENCYFFTSVIQEMLTEFHGGEVVSGSLDNQNFGRRARQAVRRRFTAAINQIRYVILVHYGTQSTSFVTHVNQ